MYDRNKTARARKLRREQTQAEKVIWGLLRTAPFHDYKFRRQLPIGPYITDFCSIRAKLIVELDGSQHLENTPQDRSRTHFLENKGYRIIRFLDNEALANTEGVLTTILQRLQGPSPYPLPQAGEGTNIKPP
jgi:very-short-patch-repair endonuclease